MGVRVGLKASAEQFGARELVELAVAAEEHGAESVFVSDHFQPWRHVGGHAPSALAWLAAAGERTRSAVLGTSVLTPHFRYNPAVVAQQFATLAVLNPGRIVLGVGSGEALNEVAAGWAGPGEHPWPAFAERAARLREAVDLMRLLWSGERVTFEGEHYAVRGTALYDVPAEPVPVYVAAGGPVMARYVGRAGDGFICTSGKGMDLYTDKLLPALAEGAAQAGRDVADLDTMIEIKVSYDPDPEAALQNTRFWAPLALTPEQKHSIDDPVDMEAAADALPLDQVASRWIVGSDPDEVVSRIAPYVRAGFRHLVLHAPGHDQLRFLRLFRDDLAPRLRAL